MTQTSPQKVSVITHLPIYHYARLEEDYILICSEGVGNPQCKALILSILEHWTNDKLSKGLEPAINMSYPQWIEAMYGLFHRNTVITSLADLLSKGMIGRTPVQYGGKESFAYTLNAQKVQQRLDTLAETTRLKINASKFKRVQKETGLNLNGKEPSPVQIQTGDASKNKRFLSSSTQLPSNLDSSDSVDATAQQDAPASKDETDSYSQPWLQEDKFTDSSPTVEAPIVRLPTQKGQTDDIPSHPRDSDSTRERLSGGLLRGQSADTQETIAKGHDDGQQHADNDNLHGLRYGAPHHEDGAELPVIEKGLDDATSNLDMGRADTGDSGAALPAHPAALAGAHPGAGESREMGAGNGIDIPSNKATPASPGVLPPTPQESPARGEVTQEALLPDATGKGKRATKVKAEKPEKPAKPAKEQKEATIAPEVQAVIDAWIAGIKKPVPMTPALIEAATLLAPCEPTTEQLQECKGFCFVSNPKWFREVKHGAVTLLDVAKNWEAWQASLDGKAAAKASMEAEKAMPPTKPPVYGTDLSALLAAKKAKYMGTQPVAVCD